MGQVDSKFINSDLKPSEVTESPWLYEKNEELVEKFNSGKDVGKWIMYFPVEEMDKKWDEAKEAYRAQKLIGISDMKVKTSWKASDDPGNYSKSKVIIFYCGPASDQVKMELVGRNLVEKIPYEDKFGWIYYKSDRQTKEGSRKTGKTKNYLYKLTVPMKKMVQHIGSDNAPTTSGFVATTSKFYQKRPLETDESPSEIKKHKVDANGTNSGQEAGLELKDINAVSRSSSPDSYDSFYDPEVDKIIIEDCAKALKVHEQNL